jgi:hypothetical protein
MVCEKPCLQHITCLDVFPVFCDDTDCSWCFKVSMICNAIVRHRPFTASLRPPPGGSPSRHDITETISHRNSSQLEHQLALLKTVQNTLTMSSPQEDADGRETSPRPPLPASNAPAPAPPAVRPAVPSPIFLEQAALANQQQQRASMSSLMFMTFFFFMMSGGSPPMGLDEIDQRRESYRSLVVKRIY